MPKTPDEIKKGLECCKFHFGDMYTDCSHCPYYLTSAQCDLDMHDDAYALIQQLEAERDALMHWAKGRCDTCAHKEDCVKHDPDPEGYVMCWYDDCEIWEWRGVPKEETK